MNIRKISRITGYALGLGALAVTGLANLAQARSVSASTGKEVIPADHSCFGVVGGGIVNNCSGSWKGWEVGLPSDNSGSKAVEITVSGAGNCYAFAADRTGFGGGSGTLTSNPNVGNGFKAYTYTNSSGFFSMPSKGVLIAGCNLFQGERIHSIQWNQ